MANYFTDNQDLVFHFDRLDLETAVSVLENGYTAVDEYPEAPTDYESAMEIYRQALELVGEISADFIAPRAAEIDEEGPTHADGKVTYARGTQEVIDKMGEAGLMGVIVPRKYGGFNLPATIYMMMIEMVSRADASFMTVFGYQDVGEAIAHFGSEEVARDFLLDYTAGKAIGSMVLTEPGAGSDLQSVQLKAFQGDDGQWRLRGTKHFISNGNGEVLLVLARSEEGESGIFGLSLFACHGGERVKVQRVEEKMGLHGSPTCELFFDDAPASLVGKQRFGLIHVMHILNHARFSVAAQGLGIAEAAYAAAAAYAQERVQFGKVIGTMPPVAGLLLEMKTALESGRSLLYAGAQWLDLRNKLEERVEEKKAAGEEFTDDAVEFKKASAIVDLLSPAVKYVITEAANKICYDAQQVHGGVGYMRELPLERYVRDVRITTIYEGTTQVQVGASLKHVLADALGELFDEMEAREYRPELAEVVVGLTELRGLYGDAITLLNEREPWYREAAARGLVDLYMALYAGYLMAGEANDQDGKLPTLERHVRGALAAAKGYIAGVENGLYEGLEAPA